MKQNSFSFHTDQRGSAWKMYHLTQFCGSLRPVDWQEWALETEITSCKWGFCLAPHITEEGIYWIKQTNPKVWAWGPRGNGTEKPVSSVSRTTNNFENRRVKSIAALSSWALQISLGGDQYRGNIFQLDQTGYNQTKPDPAASNQTKTAQTSTNQLSKDQTALGTEITSPSWKQWGLLITKWAGNYSQEKC